MNTKIIKFDLNKYKLYENIKAKQKDTKSRFLLFQLLDGSIPFDLTNRSVRAYMIKPDGNEIFNDLIINNYSLGYCTLELTNQVLAVPGKVKIELMITEEDKKLTSSVFELEVIKSINSENSIVSTNEFTALLNGLASLSEYDNYKNEIAAARDGEVNLLTKVKKIDEQLDNNTKQMINKRVENVFGNNKCILHRAACTVAPEQTTASFQMAKKLGVKVVEIDVWKTADNEFVVFHDSTLDDKTTGTGKVEDKTLAELKTLSFTKGANLDKYQNVKILSFNECMKLLKELGLNALIDFKTYTLDSSIYLKLINIIKVNGMISNVAIATWYGSQIKVIRDLEKDVCLGIEQVSNETEWNYILNNNIDFAFLTKGTHLTQENIKRLHDNYRYCIAFSVNTLDDIKKYVNYGCDYFVTDNIFEGGN